ncbi:MAG: DUF3419 family protein [Clostridia bacterium]|nr:DUF3419 family protein [Clostridia bacterium]
MDTKDIIKSEVEDYAKFNIIRYAQVWEDADILIEGLDIKEEDNILSIASAGENAISMLIKNPNKVYAIDLNDNQIACTRFKIACYKYLDYENAMKLIGVFDTNNRLEIYKKIEEKLSEETREYLNNNLEIVENGIIHSGKFENYFKIFRKNVLPLIHTKKIRDELLNKKTKKERYVFFEDKWNNLRWKMLFKIFFSKAVMGRLGRDKAFFRYVNVDVSKNILERTKYAITELDTSENPYLYYIMNGKYKDVLPAAYRKENFEKIKQNIDKITVLSETVETFIKRDDIDYINKYNLSDIFEYMSDDEMCNIFKKILNKSPIGTKVVYWNMLSPKRASKYFEKLLYKEEEAKKLFKEDKAFFYSDFIIEEIK